jgi:hypothetical protein
MSEGDDQNRLEHRFTREALAACDRLERDIGYNPTEFRRMVTEYGGVESARRLLNVGPGQSGLERLWQHARLADSLEAHVLHPDFETLFTWRELRRARDRLVDHGFNVDAFLARLRRQS